MIKFIMTPLLALSTQLWAAENLDTSNQQEVTKLTEELQTTTLSTSQPLNLSTSQPLRKHNIK